MFTPFAYSALTNSSVPSLKSSCTKVNNATCFPLLYKALAPCPCFKAASNDFNNEPETIDLSALSNDTSSPFNFAEIPFSISEISVNSSGSIDSSFARAITA